MAEKFLVRVHAAAEGGYWAEVPALPGCVSEGDNLDELIENIVDAIELHVSVADSKISANGGKRIAANTRTKVAPETVLSSLEFAAN